MDKLDNMAVTHRLTSMGFRVYSAEEIRKMSVKEITDPQPFDSLNLPRIGGLHDPALGCSRNDDVCPTCGLSGRGCPGHVGHIELVLPVFNPVFFGTLLKILKGSCMMCHRLALADDVRELFICQMRLLQKGYVTGVWRLKQYAVSYKAEKAEHFDSFKEEMFANLRTMVKETMEQDASEVARHSTKLVQDEMLAVMNDAQEQLANAPKVCPHCKSKKLSFASEYSSRIIARGYLARTVKSKGKKGQSQEQQSNAPTEITEEEKELRNLLESGGNQCCIMPHLARRILHKILISDGQLLRSLYPCLQELTDNWSATDLFFISVLMVPPNHFRPLSVMGDRKFENPQTASLSRILADNVKMRLLVIGMSQDGKTKLIEEEGEKEALDTLRSTWTQLQTHVNVLIDSNLDKLNQHNKEVQGVRQILEKKEGLFRMHMMGKRVNYSARSVISPDVSINTNEIGLPDVFAQKLTYPQPVTPWNVHELRKNVINGPDNYPGASHVVYEDGSVVRLNPKDRTQREALAKTLLTPTGGAERSQLPKKVLRHVKDGDILLLNRQPTLHRPSIQAHKARVLPGLKTLRLHYSSCKAYNADFDGDEMNAHLPQSELGRAEGYGIASTDFQYLVPKDGAPLAGLIQDHLVAGVILTQRGRCYRREEYLQLVHVALGNRRNRTLTLLPAIIKPGPFWTGKQVVSTVLLNLIPKDKVPLSLSSKTKIAEKSWVTDPVQEHWLHSVSKDELQEQGESTVLVSHGDLMQGVLDKSQCGPSAFGLVHYVYELYGGEVTGQLLTCLGRLFTECLKWRGFTLGLHDFFVKDKAEKKRAQLVKKSLNKGRKGVVEALGLKKEGEEEECSDEQLTLKMREAHFDEDPVSMQRLDVAAKRLTFAIQDRIAEKTMGKGLDTCFPYNNLQLMVQSGAKGSTVNCLQVSGLLGQIELEGRRPPLMMSGRSLPGFLPYDPSLKARGFVTSRFLTGITPRDFFPHCMAGREGLVDTAVKTSRSGYLQRCLIKHMEGLCVKYDMTVRDSDNSVIQFLYGEDGLEVTKTGLLNEKQFPFLLKNQAVLGSHPKHATDSKAVEKHKKKIKKWEKKHPEKSSRGSGFLDFCQSRSADSAVNGDAELDMATGRSARSKALEVEWRSLTPKEKEKFLKKHRPRPDPVVAKFWPQLSCGAISDKMQRAVRLYHQQLQEKGKHSKAGGGTEQSAEDCEMLNKLVNHRVMRSLCEPGDPVGVLCAQSLGEQTTQMTLNTFHFAGRGEMNVTMGLPRLRELLMTASAAIQTPCMDVPVLDTPQAAQAARTLQLQLNQVFLRDVLQDVFIDEWLEESSDMAQRKIKIRFVFLPTKMYSDKLQMKRKAVIQLLEKSGFFGLLGEAIYKFLMKHRRGTKKHGTFQARAEKPEREEESMEVEAVEEEATHSDHEDDDSDGDADSDGEKDVQEYEGEEEEKEEGEGEEEGNATLPKDMEDNPSEENQSSDSEDSETEAAEDEGIAKTKESRLIPDYSKHKKGKWCEVVYQFKTHAMESNVRLTVEKQVKKFTLQNVPGIKRCLLTERSDDDRFRGQKRLFLVTDGVNMMEIMNHSDILDIKHMYTNSIVDIQNTFGIEAANRAIIKEVKNVFKAYNIQVDYRHLSLLADYMTCEGRYKGFSRNSIVTNPSPLQKITFETSVNFLVSSCLNASADDLLSPSAQIVTGRVVSSGTGCFDIMESLVL